MNAPEDDSSSSLRALMLGVVFCLSATSLNAQQLGNVAADVRLEIETDHASYQVGDSIMVRVTLHNTSDHPVLYQSGTFTAMADLRVIDETGRVIPPPGLPFGAESSGPLRTFPPGGSLTLVFWKAPPRREWLNLRDWGYELRTPGRYKIVGTPRIGGAPRNGLQMSNEAPIVIER